MLLVFVRISGLLVAAPFFGQSSIPVRVRVLGGAVLAYVLAGFATGPLPAYVGHDVGFVLVVLVEAATGLLIGFTARLLFWAVNDSGTMGTHRNSGWLNAANIVLVMLAVALSVLSARDVVGAIFGGGL